MRWFCQRFRFVHSYRCTVWHWLLLGSHCPGMNCLLGLIHVVVFHDNQVRPSNRCGFLLRLAFSTMLIALVAQQQEVDYDGNQDHKQRR